MKTIAVLLTLAAASAQDRHVVLISLDGFAAYALRDPQTPAPTLRRLIAEGAWAPDGMTNINPTVTWPNHTTMVTGVDASRHGVLYNGLPVRKNGKVSVEPWVPKSELVLAPTVYDAAHAAGLTTAEIDWVAIEDAPTITWSFAERPRNDAPVVKELIAAGVISSAGVENFAKAPITYRDEIWTLAAIHILKKHRPNLLLFHLLTTDSSQHRYGARSLGALSALALADRQVERLITAVKETGYLDRTTFIVLSDHGFHSAKRLIRPAVLAKGVTVIPEGGTAMIYGNTPASLFDTVEGISEVIGPDKFAAYGFPPAGGRMADLVLAAADGYAFSGATDGPVVSDVAPGASSGNHGYLNTMPDMRPIFIVWGAGVKAGAQVSGVRTIDIAPTIAKILGIKFDGAAGEPVAQAFSR